MKKTLCIFLMIIGFASYAQEETKGTIKVQKKGDVYAVMFDNVNYRLVGKDHYGNILDSAVVSYSIVVTVQGVAFTENVTGTTLSPMMQQRLSRVDRGTKAFFSNIKVKQKGGEVIDWPKFDMKFGYAYEKEE